ncbi:hypothetical protein ZWY2020_046256 [Hordeum vulgare]|nr:hypothetical protein ZWY2020_046256 [Hordeum vulgare]
MLVRPRPGRSRHHSAALYEGQEWISHGAQCKQGAQVVVVGLSATTTAVLGGGKHHRGVLSTPVRLLKPDVRVSRLGGAGTVGDALKLWKEPTEASKYFVIYVTAGTYDEQLITVVNKKVVLIGDDAGRTIITGNRSDKTGHNVKQSATMSVLADHITSWLGT